jgi:tetratricopeptide (TPR) repeat protein
MQGIVVEAQPTAKKPAKPVVLTKEQIAAMKKDAADYFKTENYKSAIELYRQLQVSDPVNTEFNYRLGMCYLNTNINKGMAANFLINAANKKDAPKDVNFFLGRALLHLGELDDAIDSYEKYKIANGGKTNPKFNYENNVEWCYHARDLKKAPVNVAFNNLGKSVNSPQNDYRPVCDLTGENVYFSSNRKGNTGAIVDGYGEVISDGYVTSHDTGYSKAKNLGANINSMGYEEPLYINANSDRMLIFREGGDASSPLYTAELNGKSFDRAMPVAKFPASKIEGACMTNNGKTIYFSADLKGGKGGKDIWMTTLNDKGEWNSPKNLGEGVNTKFDEVNPWLFFDEKTLFFASEGHNSMGGFDIFMSSQTDASQDWSVAKNIGYPLNSTDDDKFFSLTADGKSGYISALRPEGNGETDIYKFTTKEPLLAVNAVVFKANFLKADGTTAKDASCIIVRNDTGESIGLFKANSITGRVNAMLIPGTYKIKVKGIKSGRLEEDFTITGEEKGKIFSKTFKLLPAVKEGK